MCECVKTRVTIGCLRDTATCKWVCVYLYGSNVCVCVRACVLDMWTQAASLKEHLQRQ